MAMLSEGIWITRRILGLRHLPVSVKTIALVVLLEEKPRLMNIPQARGIAENTPASTNV
jgi:hypothetical protein